VAEALDIAERLRQAVQTIKIDTPSGSFGFTVSMGVAAFVDEDRTFDGLLSRCDAALYAAKDAGRNRIEAG
jgi:diguanylate cyclase (GGDEF)-like protein